MNYHKTRYMGFDPSLCNWGWVLVETNPKGGSLSLVDMGTIRITADSSIKKPNERLLDRTGRLWDALQELPYAWVQGTFVEAPVGSQSASARDSYAACIALLSVMTIPLTIVTPREVKAVSGNPKASKREMVDWATYKYPHDKWKVRGNEYCLNNEHQADALAAVVAGLRKEQ